MAARTIEDGDLELQRRIAALRNSPVSNGVSVEQRWVVTRPKQDATGDWRSEVVAAFFTEQEAEHAARRLMKKEDES